MVENALLNKKTVDTEKWAAEKKKAMKTVGLAQVVSYSLKTYFEAHKNEKPATGLYDRVLREVEKPLLEHVMHFVGYNQVKAAELLGINRNTLRKKLNALKIKIDR